jgi:hypothetical protein
MLPTVHMVVKNEDRFIWYSIISVIDFASKIFVTDTGSTDKTEEIISLINSPKIFFERKKIETSSDISKIRQEHILKTETEWFWVVDGDEVYSKELCLEVKNIIDNISNNTKGIIVGRYDLMGDIYHYQDESVGTYNLFGKAGHNVLRLINKNKIKDLHVEGNYPYEGYYDSEGIEIINHDSKDFIFTKGKMFHAMYLRRSTIGARLLGTFHRNKWKIESGHKIEKGVTIPEVFYSERPGIVPEVISKRPYWYETAAVIITPVKHLKRRFIK